MKYLLKYGCSLLQLVLLFLSVKAYSQVSGNEKKLDVVREVVVEESGIHAMSSHAQDTILIDLANNSVVYNYPEDVISFWYKIYVKKDCEITFEIFPAEANNRYNYFLYQNKGDLNVSEVVTRKINPVRANLYVDEMEGGTGLSKSSRVDYDDTSMVSKAKRFYHSAYHGAIAAMAGDVLLLNIYHMKGNDCGHQFILKSNSKSQKFQSLHNPCFSNLIKSVKTDKVINLRLPPKPIVKQTTLKQEKAVYLVWDSLKHIQIEAEIVWTKKKKNSYTTIKGSGDILLEKNTYYFLSFSAVGYRPKSVSFLTGDTLSSFTRYLFLTPVKEGEDFSMDKIYFYPNTYAMRPEAASELNKLLKYLKANPDIKIEIQGFTNGNNRIKASPDDMSEGAFTGSSKRLSQMRADVIKSYLIEQGISADRLSANGYGGSKMIYEKPRNQEEANKNIRVGILILSQRAGSLASQSTSKK